MTRPSLSAMMLISLTAFVDSPCCWVLSIFIKTESNYPFYFLFFFKLIMDGRSRVSACKAWWTRPVIPRPRLPRSEKFHSAHLGRFVFRLYDKVCRIGKFYIIFFPKVMLCKRLPLTLKSCMQETNSIIFIIQHLSNLYF